MSHPVNITTGLVLRPVPGPHWVLFRHLFTEEIRAGDTALGHLQQCGSGPSPVLAMACLCGGLYAGGDGTGLLVPILSQGIRSIQQGLGPWQK